MCIIIACERRVTVTPIIEIYCMTFTDTSFAVALIPSLLVHVQSDKHGGWAGNTATYEVTVITGWKRGVRACHIYLHANHNIRLQLALRSFI